MGREELSSNLLQAKANLFAMVEDSCLHNMSHNCSYFTTVITPDEAQAMGKKLMKAKLRQAHIMNFEELLDHLELTLADIYTVDLEVFQAKKSETILEVRFLLSSSLQASAYLKGEQQQPSFHAKIVKPLNVEATESFDVNWRWKHRK